MTIAPTIVWLNGRFLPSDQARISPVDHGFLFGDGLFESLRADKGRTLYLDSHLARLARSQEDLNLRLTEKVDWAGVLSELLDRNGLSGGTAKIKIVVTRGEVSGLGIPAPDRPTVLALAQPYQLPADETYAAGWKLHGYREGYSPPTARHKTLNYLYFLMAKQAARDAGADEAVLFDPRGFVAETGSGSLLARTDGRWWTTEPRHRLPGTTLEAVGRLLAEDGLTIDERPAGTEDLLSADALYVLGSMIGVMPARSLDGRPVKGLDPAAAADLRRRFVTAG